MDAAAGDLRIAYQECPLCGGSALAQEWTADCTGHPLYCEPLPRELRWLRCEACGHVFTDSYFNDAGLAALFRGVPAGQTPGLLTGQPEKS